MPRAQDREIPENVPCRPLFLPLGPSRPKGRTIRTIKILAGLFLVSFLLSLFCLSSLLAFLFGGLTIFFLVATAFFFIFRRFWSFLRRFWR